MLRVPRGRATIVVACSGGADSAAALHIVRRARPHARIVACYVDHGMRPAASVERDRRAVRAQARAARAQTAFVALAERPEPGRSPEAALRAARYRTLADAAARAGASCVVSGHHRDDVAESTLLAMVRGSGVDGIAAMRPRRRIGAGVDLVRPLLWASKGVLAAYASAAGLATSVDETNADTRYRRNAIRRLLAQLEASMPGSGRAISRSAAIVVEDKSLLDAVTQAARDRCATPDGRALIAAQLRKLPAALLRRVLRHEVRRVTGSLRDFTYEQCAAIADAVASRRGGSHHAGGARVMLSAGKVKAERAAARVEAVEEDPVPIRVPDRRARVDFHGGAITLRMREVRASPTSRARQRGRNHLRHDRLQLDGRALPAGTVLTLRRPAAGDRFVPSGRHTDAPLARFLSKAGLVRSERRLVPLLCQNGRVVAVVGVRAAAGYLARPGGPVLEVAWEPPNAPGPDESADE